LPNNSTRIKIAQCGKLRLSYREFTDKITNLTTRSLVTKRPPYFEIEKSVINPFKQLCISLLNQKVYWMHLTRVISILDFGFSSRMNLGKPEKGNN
jgi:hypothetical protein